MDIFDLEASGIGLVPNVEELAALETEMERRKIEESLVSIRYWGRIVGTVKDYIIVCGITSLLEHPVRKYYYMTADADGLALKQMPELSDEHRKAAAALSSRFSGNPSGTEGGAENDDAPADDAEGGGEEEGAAAPRRVRFTEAHRLAHTVLQIDSECAVVPRGAFTVTPTHHVVASPAFVGLSASEADDLAAYCHFRPAAHPSRKGALSRAATLGAGDFLDPLSEDEPAGVWSVALSLRRGAVQLRTALWPGYFFWHALATPRHGSIYHGDGRRNNDLPFSL